VTSCSTPSWPLDMVLGEEERAINGGDSAMILVSEDGLCDDGGAGEWMVGFLYTSCVVAVVVSETVLELPSGMWSVRCREGEDWDCGIEESDSVTSVGLNVEGVYDEVGWDCICDSVCQP
jgi:hypothetical protein